MAYHIYHTEALILESRPFGEGDRLLSCYTRELGLVVAHAKSLREMRSKLRYALTTFAHAEIDLIHGKHGWKLISARPVESHSSLLRSREKRLIFAQHAGLIRRLIQGEERHERLFDEILAAIDFLHNEPSGGEFRSAELLFVVRLLSELGYWENKDEFSSLLHSDAWGRRDVLKLVEVERPRVLTLVNSALRATQL